MSSCRPWFCVLCLNLFHGCQVGEASRVALGSRGVRLGAGAQARHLQRVGFDWSPHSCPEGRRVPTRDGRESRPFSSVPPCLPAESTQRAGGDGAQLATRRGARQAPPRSPAQSWALAVGMDRVLRRAPDTLATSWVTGVSLF